MPAAIALIPLITGIAGAGVSAYAASRQAGTAQRTQTVQQQAADAALEFQKQQEAQAKAQYDQEYARKTALEDADRARQAGLDQYAQQQDDYAKQQTAERRARLAPYVAFGQQGVNTLSSLLTPRTSPAPRMVLPNTRPTVYAPPAQPVDAPVAMPPPVNGSSLAAFAQPAPVAQSAGVPPLSAFAQPPVDPRLRYAV